MLLPVEQKIWDLIKAGVEDLGLRLVRVKYMTAPKQKATLQIMIEPFNSSADNRLSVNVDECAAVSRMAAAILDVEDPISEAYNLEVSSTGLQRPLIAREDFNIYQGLKAKLELIHAIENQKRFTAVINCFENDTLTITEIETNKQINVDYSALKKVSLYYTQAEIDEMFRQEKGE